VSPAQEVTSSGQAEPGFDDGGFTSQLLVDMPWSGMLEDLDPAMFLQEEGSFDLLAWDMTGLLAEAQSKYEP